MGCNCIIIWWSYSHSQPAWLRQFTLCWAHHCSSRSLPFFRSIDVLCLNQILLAGGKATEYCHSGLCRQKCCQMSCYWLRSRCFCTSIWNRCFCPRNIQEPRLSVICAHTACDLCEYCIVFFKKNRCSSLRSSLWEVSTERRTPQESYTLFRLLGWSYPIACHASKPVIHKPIMSQVSCL